MTGHVFGLGVGPGDPELLTLKALARLRAAHVVAYPAPENGRSFARSIVARWLSPAQIEIPVRVPIESGAPPESVYDAAAAAIAAELERNRDVAVLCQGDPFFYGSFIYLFARLAATHEVEIVPGVSSLAAVAAAAKWPLAARNDMLAVIPAPLDDAAIERRIACADAIAIVKLGRHFARIRDLLMRLGLTPHARYVERASLDNERVLSLAEVAPETVPYFSMIVCHRRGEAWR
ncbi:MAG TPA: precorrin-2 C(20)-methyltransferase [Stellaceae bacterium]|nr:precorrin-2 C(20)-methyltransferase [Stellaceae bacterium]